MKTRYYVKIASLGSDETTYVTSDDEKKVKDMWRNLFKRWRDRGIMDFSRSRFTFRINSITKECSHGSYSFSGEDPHKDSVTL